MRPVDTNMSQQAHTTETFGWLELQKNSVEESAVKRSTQGISSGLCSVAGIVEERERVCAMF